MRYTAYIETKPREWTGWIAPNMASYKMACCDCGLVHEIEFRAARVMSRKRDVFELEALPRAKFKVVMRVRRDNRATGQLRRHRKHGLDVERLGQPK